MTARVRQMLLLLTTTLGLVAVTAGPASAGLSFSNHCEPTNDEITPNPAADSTAVGTARRTARRGLLLLATTLGLVAATAGPASAGLIMSNHCEPRDGIAAPPVTDPAPPTVNPAGPAARPAIRQALLLLATTAGVIGATAGPASAGIMLSNHCEPSLSGR